MSKKQKPGLSHPTLSKNKKVSKIKEKRDIGRHKPGQTGKKVPEIKIPTPKPPPPRPLSESIKSPEREEAGFPKIKL